MQLDILIVFLFSTFALTLSPGPDIIYVFYRSISNGKLSGIRTVSTFLLSLSSKRNLIVPSFDFWTSIILGFSKDIKFLILSLSSRPKVVSSSKFLIFS